MPLKTLKSSKHYESSKNDTEIKLRVICSVTDMTMLKKEWDSLLPIVKNPTPFQSWEWNYGLAKQQNSSLQIRIVIAYNKNGRVIGIAPLCLRKHWIPGVKIMELIGSGPSDYLDFLVEEKYESIFSKIVFDWIRENKEWRILNFVSLRERTKNLISPYLSFKFFEQVICPYLLLPSSFEVFQKEMSKSLFKSIRKRLNKLLPEKRLQFLVPKSPQDFHYYMKELLRLHQKRWNAKGQRGRFSSEESQKQFYDLSLLMYNADMLKLGILKIDSVIAAVHYHLVFKDKEYGFLKGMDTQYLKFSPSNLLHYLMIEDAINNGTSLLDFLQGSQQDKNTWTNGKQQLYNAIYARTKIELLIWMKIKNIRSYIYNSRIIKKIYSNTIGKIKLHFFTN